MPAFNVPEVRSLSTTKTTASPLSGSSNRKSVGSVRSSRGDVYPLAVASLTRSPSPCAGRCRVGGAHRRGAGACLSVHSTSPGGRLRLCAAPPLDVKLPAELGFASDRQHGGPHRPAGLEVHVRLACVLERIGRPDVRLHLA